MSEAGIDGLSPGAGARLISAALEPTLDR
jgi:hypothetical protein